MPFTTVTPDYLYNIEQPMEWVLRGLLGERCKLGIYGEEGIGKSFLTLQLVYSIASGVPWLDRFIVPRPRKVLYVCGEGGKAQIRGRLMAMREFGGAQLSQEYAQLCFGYNERLEEEESFERLWDEIITRRIDTQYVEDSEGRRTAQVEEEAGVIVIDNILAFSKGGMTYDQTVPFRQNMDRLIEGLGVTIVLIHHSRKPDYQKGSKMNKGTAEMLGGGWTQWFHSVVRVEGDGGQVTERIMVQKFRDGGTGSPLELSFDTDSTMFHAVDNYDPWVMAMRLLDEYGPMPTPTLLKQLQDHIHDLGGRDPIKTKTYERGIRRLNDDGLIDLRDCTKEEWPHPGHRAHWVSLATTSRPTS
jgi:hypothetical protein